MSTESKDLIVLGSGPGGYTAAVKAAQLGRQVTIIERDELGGVCLNWGCMPTKALIRSAELLSNVHRAEEFGLKLAEVQVDYEVIWQRSREVVEQLTKGLQFLMKKNKIEVLQGTGTLKGNKQIEVKNASNQSTLLSYNDIIIATGAQAKSFPNAEIDGKLIHNARSILEYQEIPQKLLVIGAGAIGIEFAYLFSTLGSEVTVVELQEHLLPLEDHDISKQLKRILTKKGISIITNASIESLDKSSEVLSANFKVKEQSETWKGDCGIVAIGISPNTKNIGLEAANINIDQRGFIQVDDFMRTNADNHYAIGDVVASPALAHVASHEALIAAQACCKNTSHAIDYRAVPSCTYCQPQVASVGLTEKEAKAKNLDFKSKKLPFSAIGKAVAIGETEGFIKVLIEEKSNRILGVHILHAEATELISEAVLAITADCLASDLANCMHPHPTLAEALMEVMR